jgi:hypothetical protein
MDHNEYPKSLRDKSWAELNFIVQDCRKAMEALPDNPKNSHYADEIAYVAGEKARRVNLGTIG